MTYWISSTVAEGVQITGTTGSHATDMGAGTAGDQRGRYQGVTVWCQPRCTIESH